MSHLSTLFNTCLILMAYLSCSQVIVISYLDTHVLFISCNHHMLELKLYKSNCSELRINCFKLSILKAWPILLGGVDLVEPNACSLSQSWKKTSLPLPLRCLGLTKCLDQIVTSIPDWQIRNFNLRSMQSGGENIYMAIKVKHQQEASHLLHIAIQLFFELRAS